MTSVFSRRRLLLGALLLLAGVDGILLAASSARASRAPEAVWSEVASDDATMAGVFATLRERGLAAALDSLERLAASDSSVLRSGHQLAHALGRDALAAGGGDVRVIGQCRAVFASGCYHGVVEASLNARGRIEMPELERMCLAAGNGTNPKAITECMHGLGHGLLGAVKQGVFDALRHCDSLSSPRFTTACHQGAFMEAIAVGLAASSRHRHAHHGGMAIDRRDPYSPCRGFDDPYADSCWLFQGFVILRRVGFDAGRALKVCDGAPAGRVARCYESVGHQLTGLFQRRDEWIISQCAAGRPDLAPRCSAGAVLALSGMDWTGKRVREYCAAVPSGWRDTCGVQAKVSRQNHRPILQKSPGRHR